LISELRLGDLEAGHRLSPEAESQWEFLLNWKLGK